jgi:hypothetical protein
MNSQYGCAIGLAMRRMLCYALVERNREVDKFGGDARTAVK